MKSQVLSLFPYSWLPVTGLILFVTVFIVMLIMVFRKDSTRTYNEVSNMILNEGTISHE